MTDPHAPPDFAATLAPLDDPIDDRALAEAVRVDALRCGERYRLVPTIARYAGVVDPARFPQAACELAHQVVTAARGDRGAAVRSLSMRHPAWRPALEDALAAMDILGSDDDVPSVPPAIGPPGADGMPRFIVGEVLARGSFGAIMEGFDRERAGTGRAGPDSEVAIKVVRMRDSASPWEHEARGASAIDHPCGIRVRAFGTIDATTGFVAFERVRGRSLVSMAAAGERLPAGRLVPEMGQLCEAIAELHAAGFVHGDISPANVMVDSQGHLRLVDFGLARPITQEGAAIDVVRVGELLQWVALGYVPARAEAIASVAPTARGVAVRLGAACRMRPPTASGLARRLLGAEWSIDRAMVIGLGVCAAAVLWGVSSVLTVIAR